jgi:hypothetical protein
VSCKPNGLPGPYTTDREAADDAREVYRTDPGEMTGANYKRLVTACKQARITLGAFDRQILAWLSGWEPETCQVIIALVKRAHATTEERR